MTLPPKPEAVAHVSDAHWEAALQRAYDIGGYITSISILLTDGIYHRVARSVIDHARCLILLNEVPEPVDPIEVACGLIVQDWCSVSPFPKSLSEIVRKHLGGMTIPKGETK